MKRSRKLKARVGRVRPVITEWPAEHAALYHKLVAVFGASDGVLAGHGGAATLQERRLRLAEFRERLALFKSALRLVRFDVRTVWEREAHWIEAGVLDAVVVCGRVVAGPFPLDTSTVEAFEAFAEVEASFIDAGWE
jgi:hypothetical protein